MVSQFLSLTIWFMIIILDFSTTKKIIPLLIVLGQLIFTFVVEYFWLSLLWHLLLFASSLAKYLFLTLVVFLASCVDPFDLLILFSVINDICRVMIPVVCILYSNANLKIMHEYLGSSPLLFRTLSYQLIFDPFNWHMIFTLCVYGRQTFFLDALCYHKKCRECLVYLL